MIDVNDAKPIIAGIELQEIYDPDPNLKVFRQADDGDTSTIGDEIFHPEAQQKKSRAKTMLKAFIVVTVVVVILIAIVCIVIFAGPKVKGATTKAPTRATPTATMVPTVIPGVVVGELDIELSATLNGVTFIPEYNDPSSPEYMAFASNAETEMMNGLQDDSQLGEFVTNVTVTGLSQGSVIVDAMIMVSGDIAMSLFTNTPNTTSATDLQLLLANQVSAATNEAVMTSLTNNDVLGSSDVTVEVQNVAVPINVNGVDLPDNVTPGEPCGEGLFRCNDGICIDESDRCNYIDQCDMGEDELNCATMVPTVIPGVVVEYTLDLNGVQQFTSPNYPTPYVGDRAFHYWSFDASDVEGNYVVKFTFHPYSISSSSYIEFGSGLDPSNRSSYYAVYEGHRVDLELYNHYSTEKQVWVAFYTGMDSASFPGFSAQAELILRSVIPPRVTCNSNQWACQDGLTCIPASYRCDGHHDCPANGEDEHGCPSVCREYQFECKNGECLPIHSQCNGIEQCSEGEDEVGCGSEGECTDQQFMCNDGVCILAHQKCNYFIDCPDGSDELQEECGVCNEFDEYTCNFGNCIPNYWQCDLYYDCPSGDDEMECHILNEGTNITLELMQQFNISSQNYPASADHAIYQLWHITAPEGALIHFDFVDFDLGLQSFIVFSDGHMVGDHSNEWAAYFYRFNPGLLLSHNNTISVQYYSGAYVGTRGFFLSMRAVHGGHVHPPCAETAYQCAGDQECIPAYWQCDNYPDCTLGEDEVNCTDSQPGECGVHADEYKCQDSEICFHADFRCDYISDCPNHDDEFNCPCKEGEFQCPRTGQCLPAHFVCDFYYDCIGGTEDETLGCGTPSSTLQQTLQVDQLFDIQSTNYPDFYPPRDYLVYIITAPQDYVVRVIFQDFSIDWKGFLVFGSGTDYTDHDQVFAVYNHHDTPTDLYTPTNSFYIVFHGGPYGQSKGYHISMIPIEKSATPTVIPQGTCEPGQFACFDGACLPGYYECDGQSDCIGNEDEARCYASGGTCQSHQFTCDDGTCIHESWRCDLYVDCSNGEDQRNCESITPCDAATQFTCSTEDCIPNQWQCDYFADCPNGEDETSCGACEDYQFACGDGACVPQYYVCDGYNDCFTSSDESNCGTPENTEQITLGLGEERSIQSPGYPDASQHDSLCYVEWIVTVPEGYALHLIFNDFSVPLQAWLQIGTGTDADEESSRYAIYYSRTNPREAVVPDSTAWISYHCGLYGMARGFDITLTPTNQATHNYTACVAGEFQCNDGHCIPSHYLCDTDKDCSMAEDEEHALGRVDCSSFDHNACGTHETEFQCPAGPCIHEDLRCDDIFDCPTGGDETQCPTPCGETMFECPDRQCIHGNKRCNFLLDCLSGDDDERNCGTPENTTYIYLSQNSRNITSANYPDDYPKNEYYVTKISTDPDRVIRVIFYDIDLSVFTYLAFGHGSDTQDFSALFEAYTHRSAVPSEFTSITNEIFMEFHTGVYGGSGGYFIGLEDVEASSTTFAPCGENQFQCPSDGACIPASWVCDLENDCGFNGDELNCQAQGGTCQSHQFTCDDGTCIHESWRCDVFVDCSNGEDEQNCPCPDTQFTCNATGDCIPTQWQCDYFADCPNGEDETLCGACEDDQFTCSDGACIPQYYVCDGYNDCFTSSDESNCGTPENTEQLTLSAGEKRQIQSPGYPSPHDTLCYYLWVITVPEGLYVHVIFNDFSVSMHTYLSLGTGPNPDNSTSLYAIYYHRTAPNEAVIPSNVAWLDYHCGHFANGRGFDLTVTTTNISTHVFPDCSEGQVQCYDGHCIESHFLCDTEKDCSMGEDEGNGGLANCTAYDRRACGNHDSEFECDDQTGCIHASYVCDNVYDCPFTGSDEFNCSRDCTVHEFECPGRQCIPKTLRCNFFSDCLFGDDDELNCGTPQNTEYIFLNGNTTMLMSPNFPDDYPKNTYTVTHVSTVPGKVINVTFNTLELSLLSYLSFGNGTDTHDFGQIFEVYTHKTSFPSSILSSGHELFIEFFSNIYGGSQGYDITLEAVDQPPEVTFPPCADNQFQCEGDGECIPLSFLCDLWQDCGDNSDERNCEDHTCGPDQFQCEFSGQCIPQDWVCDNFFDCPFGGDEEDCGFTCFPFEFACEDQTCIPIDWACDYYPDCPIGEDERSCGACGEGFFNCTDGACVPDYYVCDAYTDCFTEVDEDSCGNPSNTEQITLGVGEERSIQSPGYPDATQHDSLCYVEWIVTVPEGYALHLIFNDFSVPLQAWLQIGTGTDADEESSRYAIYYSRTNPREVVVPDSTAWISYHCGLYGMARGFDITLRPTNQTTHNYTACVPGEFQCNDGHCIPSHYLCDTDKDCSMAEDEEHALGRVNCSSFDHNACGTHETEFQCPAGPCIHEDLRCDDIFDCPTGVDETQCPTPCGETMFECPHQQCIHGSKRCDFHLDCLGGDNDERNCGTPENTTYIYLSQNSRNITSANYPDDYPKNEYYVTKISTDPGRVIRVIFYDMDLSINTYLAFGRGSDTQDFNALFEAYTHRSAVPSEFTSITNEIFMEFHTGIYGGSGGYLIGLEDVEASSTTFAPCDENQFQCPSDGACIHASWECDLENDCGFHGDELNCQAQGGTCEPHLFTCNDGQCIHGLYQCDFFTDCSDGSDEAGCPFGCPYSFLFACYNSSQCILQNQVCNYLPDCDMGEDEADCGPCDEGFLTCSNGGCVPNYWKCDGENDCYDGSDEVDCGTIGDIYNLNVGQNEVQEITSPGYPMRHGASCYVGWQVTVPAGLYVRFLFVTFDIALSSYVTMGTGLDHSDQDTLVSNYHHRHDPRQRVIPSNQAWIEFHCGPVGGGQGFRIEVSAIDPVNYIHPSCSSDQYQCMDESCIETFDLCNGVKDCLGGEDEDHNCTTFDHSECGTHKNEFFCQAGLYCIHADARCDGILDCPLGTDELDCECSAGEFECPGKQCIPGSYYCDNIVDCLQGNNDELNCANPNNSMAYDLTDPMNITSPNYPNDYPLHDYTVTYITVPEGMLVRARILDFDVSFTTVVLFTNGHDTESEASTLIALLSFNSEVIAGETEVLSMSTNTMAIEFHSNYYSQSRGFLIELSAVEEPTCSSDEFTCELGGCVSYNLACNYLFNCPDGSDESSCQAPEGGDCGPMLFTCYNGQCITLEYRCDFWPDCSGGEDEVDCSP